MKLTVIGCGKMGLPLAVQAASKGVDVTGVDNNPSVVASINRGEMPFNEPGVGELLRQVLREKRFTATTNLTEAVSQSDAVIVIVPVVLTDTKKADLTIIKEVTQEIARAMKTGTIISYETTLPVGTTRNILGVLLEESGLKIEKDFYLVFSPERVKSLQVMERLNTIPKVVGGLGPLSLQKGVELYQSILKAKIIGVGSLEHAEMIKIAGMIYRDVNIALVNELARYCDHLGINLPDIIPIVNTNGESHLLQPGTGVGGHCTPVYPYFLIHDARKRGVPQLLAERARKINDGQTEYIFHRIERHFGCLKGLKILLLGLAFRPEVKEDTKSTAYLMKQVAEEKQIELFLHDPLYTEQEITQRGFRYKELYPSESIDAVILLTAHHTYSFLDFNRLSQIGVRVFIDGRNCFPRDDVENAGITYLGIGKGQEHKCTFYNHEDRTSKTLF